MFEELIVIMVASPTSLATNPKSTPPYGIGEASTWTGPKQEETKQEHSERHLAGI
jgi:hypothetical protein